MMKNPNNQKTKELSKLNLPEEIIRLLQTKATFRKFKKKEIFIHNGEHQSEFFFLTSGIARAYVVDDKGREFTRILFKGVTAIASIRALITNTKSFANFDCLTECEMYVGNFEDFLTLTKTNIKISNIYSNILEKAFLRSEERVYELALTAKEKYKLLQKQIPDIDNLIPQYQIASYLNITNVQLSRIRRKMFK